MNHSTDFNFAPDPDAATPPAHDKAGALVAWLRDYAARRLNSALMDARRCMPPHVALDFGNQGLLGMQVSPELGGAGLDTKGCVRVLEQLGAIDLTLATFVVVQNFLGIRPIMNHADSALRASLLPRLASGRELVAFGLTEPVAGSNPSAMQGSAQLLANGKIRLDATKIWIGNAAWASVINVFVRYRDTSGAVRGMAGFVVPQDAPGMTMGPELMTMGMRGMVQNVFRLDGVEVDPAAQLGQPGQGMEVANDAMMYTRLALAAAFLGAMKRCLQLMGRYATRRTGVATGRLLDNPVSLIRIGKHAAQARALECLLALVATRLDRGDSVPQELLVICKVSGSEFLCETADSALQLLGGRGYLENNEITRIVRDARVGRIFEGPTETMWHFLGSRLQRDGESLLDFIRCALAAPDVAGELREACVAVQQRCLALAPPFAGRQRSDLASFLLGQVVSWAVLHAVCRQDSEGHPDQARVVAWTRSCLAASLQAARHGTGDEAAMPDAAQAGALIASYGSAIGDIEQTLAGEALALDPYLQRAERDSYTELM